MDTVLVWLVVGLVAVCGGSKVLVVSPVPSPSHAILTDSVVKILLTAGHEVTYVSSYSKLKSGARLTCVNITSVDHDDTGGVLRPVGEGGGAIISTTMPPTKWPLFSLMDFIIQSFGLAWNLPLIGPLFGGSSATSAPTQDQSPHRMLEEGVEFAQRLLRHEAVKGLLSDTNGGYDAVVAEWCFSGLLAPLAAVYDCPLIWYSTMDINWIPLQLVHEQTNPAYTVDSHAKATVSQPYDLKSRLYRLGRQVYLAARIHYMTYYVEVPLYEELYHPFFKLRDRVPPHYESLVYNGSLLLVNSNHLVGQSLPLPANVKYVGGHHLEENTKPLPKQLQNLLDSAKHGVILFSLGSHAKSQNLVHQVKHQLLQMFEQLEQIVIWTTDERLDHLPENVFTFKWVPQTSILNHSNTILFISDGELTSVIEATYYGVPVIGIPLAADQFINIDLAQTRGRAIRVDYSHYLAYELRKAINDVLGNYSYRNNVKIAADLFQNSLVSPQHELLHYIELVIRTKGALHLRSPALHLSTIERLYLDAVVLLLLVLWFFSKVVKVVQVHMKTEDEDKKNK